MVPETADADLLSNIPGVGFSSNSTPLPLPRPLPPPPPHIFQVRGQSRLVALETKVAVMEGRCSWCTVSAYIRRSPQWNHVSLKVWFVVCKMCKYKQSPLCTYSLWRVCVCFTLLPKYTAISSLRFLNLRNSHCFHLDQRHCLLTCPFFWVFSVWTHEQHNFMVFIVTGNNFTVLWRYSHLHSGDYLDGYFWYTCPFSSLLSVPVSTG